MKLNYDNLFLTVMLIQLKAGDYAVTLDCFRLGKRQIWFTADWEGPDMTRRSFLPNVNIVD